MRRRARATFVTAALCSFFAFAGQALAVAPTVTIDPSPTASYTTIEGTGTVDPGDQEVGLYVEYTTDPGGVWSEKSLESIPANAGPTPVSYEITGLTPGTQYYVRLDAWNGGYNLSSELPVATLAAGDPPSVSIDPVATFTATTAHFSGEVDTATGANPADATWRFQCLPECPGLSGGLVPAGESKTVEADASDLLPGTTYLVILVAEAPWGQWIAGPESFTTLANAPQIENSKARPRASEATLEGTINPGGAETTYYFEYGSSSSYGKRTGAKVLAAGPTPISIRAKVTGLEAASTYHYQLVATNPAGTSKGLDHTFTTEAAPVSGGCPNEAVRIQQGATDLPECRAYEMVSPVEKGGVDVLGYTQTPYTEAGPTGDSIAYSSSAAFGDAAGAAFPSIYRAMRGANGWASTLVSPPQNATLYGGFGGGNTSVVNFCSSDLSSAIVRTNRALDSGASENVMNLFRSDLQRGSYDLLSPGGPSAPDTTTDLPHFAWATPDLSAVAFTSKQALTPGALPGSGNNTYVYRNGNLELASVLTDGTAISATPGEFDGSDRSNAMGAISADGKRVFLSSESSRGLWVRDLETGVTTEIVGPGEEARYVAASEDGSRVMWMATDPVVNELQLYIYDVDSGTTTSLPDDEPSDGAGSVFAVFAASHDLSSVYLTSRSKLVAGQPAPPADWGGGYAIYRWQPRSHHVTFVSYFEGGTPYGNLLASIVGPGAAGLATRHDVATTPDGSMLVFATDAQVAQGPAVIYDNASTAAACNDAGGGERVCREVYRYDAASDSVDCLSCPDGVPRSNAGLLSEVGGNSSARQLALAQPRAVSADGSKTFFETRERLAPGDANGHYDVYMWKGASPRLITSGTSNYDFRPLDASASGDDVFVVTRARLVARDKDDLADLYDVRVDGGLPEPPPPAPDCADDECQGPSSSAPAASVAASGAVVAAGSRHCSLPRAGVKARRARHLHDRATRLRARSKALRRLSRRAKGQRAVRLRRESRRLSRKAAVSSAKGRKLARHGPHKRRRTADCRGVK